MGSIELALLLKYGLPLAIKLLDNSKDTDETIEVVTSVIAGMYKGNVSEALINADDEQTESIITALFDVITGVSDAVGNLIKAFGRLLFKIPAGVP